jgi:hypothetical protein
MENVNMTTDYIKNDWFNLCVGKKLGSGSSRDVYEYLLDGDFVLKIEEGTYSFKNVLEWQLWLDSEFLELKNWLAPIRYISPCGSILMQKRVYPCLPTDLPDKVPSCLTDLKLENWGWYNGKIVCCDYANHINSYSMKLKKADWRLENDK